MKQTKNLPPMSMDNFKVDVTARGSDVLSHTIELALCGHFHAASFTEVTVGDHKMLVLHWYYREGSGQTKFPYPFKLEQLLPFITGWLENQDYGSEPDLDGSCSKGWSLFTNIPYEQRKTINQAWDCVLFAVRPEWAEHHK